MSDARKSSHPHFDDRGAVRWYTRLADALEAAKREGKFVFVEYGRYACGNCRALVEGIIPQATVAALLNEHFVCLASDCDRPETEIRAIGAHHMAYARALPFCLYLNSDGEFVHGTQGGVSMYTFREDLERVIKS